MMVYTNKKKWTSNVDVLIVVMGMIIGFSVILMHLTHTWPCNMMNSYDKLYKTRNHDSPGSNNFIDDMLYWLKGFFRCN